ncbi:hypothetical protein cypCar_00031806, partial [Cyprinus carpio]
MCEVSKQQCIAAEKLDLKCWDEERARKASVGNSCAPSVEDTAMSTCPAPHMSIGQHGLHGNAAQFHAAVGSSRDDECARMETNAPDAAFCSPSLGERRSEETSGGKGGEEFQSCNTLPCPDLKKTTPWTPWTPVNISDNGGHYEQRFRYTCKARVPEPSLLEVGRQRIEMRYCSSDGSTGCSTDGDLLRSGRISGLTVNGGWSAWGPWSQCSRTVSGVPKPQNGYLLTTPNLNMEESPAWGLPRSFRSAILHHVQ